MTPKEQAIQYAAAYGFTLGYDNHSVTITRNGWVTPSRVTGYTRALLLMQGIAKTPTQPQGVSRPWMLNIRVDGSPWKHSSRHANYADAVRKLRQGFSDGDFDGIYHLTRATILYHPFP